MRFGSDSDVSLVSIEATDPRPRGDEAAASNTACIIIIIFIHTRIINVNIIYSIQLLINIKRKRKERKNEKKEENSSENTKIPTRN